MLLFDGLLIAVITTATALTAAVAYVVVSLSRAAPLIAARTGRARVDIVLISAWHRSALRPATVRRPVAVRRAYRLQPN